MDCLLELLGVGGSDGVDGSLRVLTEFVKEDLSEDQLIPSMQKMLPHLLSILRSPEVRLGANLSYASLITRLALLCSLEG